MWAYCLITYAQLRVSTLIQFRTTCLGNDATLSRLRLPTTVNSDRQSPTDMLVDQPTLCRQSLIPSQVIVVWVNLTVKADQHTLRCNIFVCFPFFVPILR